MCRRNHLFGWMVLSFGLGVLIGLCLEACFLSSFAGLMLVLCGFYLLRQR